MTRPGDIAVGSSGLRLARPQPQLAQEPASSTGEPCGPAASTVVGATQSVTGSPHATSGTPTTTGTTQHVPGSTQAPNVSAPPPAEREIAFTLMTSMSSNDERDAVRRLLLDLSNAVDEGHASWAQIQMKVVVSADIAGQIEQAVRETGSNPSSRDV